ncbi:MAG: nitrilase-related carbon-nitrogen hydrolase, partial [bacterium]|nr:nitrilase-related carbon-nitrogen hydrolase [bacterium]
MKTILAAAIQMTSGSKKDENYKKVAHFGAEAIAQKAELIVLPEHWDWLGPVADKKAMAEGLDGPSLHFIRELAKKYHCYFVAGSIGEKNGDKPPYNTSVLVYPDGKLGKAYRKIHLFDTL